VTLFVTKKFLVVLYWKRVANGCFPAFEMPTRAMRLTRGRESMKRPSILELFSYEKKHNIK
jgi:hypothetical protein